MSTAQRFTLRPLQEAELDALYTSRMEADFPSAERPSLSAMHRHMQQNLQEIWLLQDEGTDVAYAVVALANGIALVTLLAVFEDARGSGYGTALLSCLREQYQSMRAITLEVEAPEDAEDEVDRETRTRRIAFYTRNGFAFIPGVHHVSFGIRLLVMAFPLTDTMEAITRSTVEDMIAIYHKILPPERWENVTTQMQ